MNKEVSTLHSRDTFCDYAVTWVNVNENNKSPYKNTADSLLYFWALKLEDMKIWIRKGMIKLDS